MFLKKNKLFFLIPLILFFAGFLLTVSMGNYWLADLKAGPDLFFPVFHDLQRVGSFVLCLSASLFICLSAYLWGQLISSRFLKVTNSPYISIGIGFYFLSLIAFTLGVLHLLYPGLLIFVTFVPLLLLLNDRSALKILWQKLDIQSYSKLKWLLVALFTTYLFYHYAQCFSPVVQSDGVRYHITIPQIYLQNHYLVYCPLNAFSNFPFTIEMIFLYGLSFGSDIIAKFLHFHFFILFIGLLWQLLPEKMNRFMKISFLCAVLFIPSAPIVACWSFVDFGLNFFLFLHLLAVKRYFLCDSERNWLYLALFFMGVAFSCKYSILPVMAFDLLLLFCFFMRRMLPMMRRWRALCIMVLLLSFPILPYVVKNVIYTGNPVYPLANNLFHGGEWTSEDSAFYMNKASEKGLDKDNPLNLLRSPYYLTTAWRNYEAFNPGIGFLFFFIALFFFRRKRSFSLFLQLFCLFFFIFWFYSYQSNRFLIPVIFGSIICFFYYISTMRFRQPLLVIVLLFSLINARVWSSISWNNYNPFLYLSGMVSERQFQSRHLSYYPFLRSMKKLVLAPDERILFIGEHRAYGFPWHSVLVADWFDPPYVLHFIRKYQPANGYDLLHVMQEKEGVRYVFYSRSEFNKGAFPYFKKRFSNEQWKVYLQFEDMVLRRAGQINHELMICDLNSIPRINR